MTCDLTGDFQTQRQAVDQMPYPTLTVRRDQLDRLARMTKHHQLEIIRAIQADFGQRPDDHAATQAISVAHQQRLGLG